MEINFFLQIRSILYKYRYIYILICDTSCMFVQNIVRVFMGRHVTELHFRRLRLLTLFHR